MTTIVQLPQELDANVTVNVPSPITIDYKVEKGWYINIDYVPVTYTVYASRLVRYFETSTEAFDWLLERDLLVTKVYDETRKVVKKISKANKLKKEKES